MVKCKHEGCVEERQVCDGSDDCGDGTDEENCGEKSDMIMSYIHHSRCLLIVNLGFNHKEKRHKEQAVVSTDLCLQKHPHRSDQIFQLK